MGAASREHARIECHRGRFSLVDQSVNGSYVVREGGSRSRLRRDKEMLEGSGVISLGQPPEEAPDQIIQFECE